MLLPTPTRLTGCAFTGCKAIGTEKHHITYGPEVTKWLCKKHHEEITAINSVDARKYRRGLSNKHRWFLWFQWLEGKRKPRRTHLTKAWKEGLVCLYCGSRSLKRSRTWDQWECKSCGGANIGNMAEFQEQQNQIAQREAEQLAALDDAMRKLRNKTEAKQKKVRKS